jgi:hypothetical protein
MRILQMIGIAMALAVMVATPMWAASGHGEYGGHAQTAGEQTLTGEVVDVPAISRIRIRDWVLAMRSAPSSVFARGYR